MKECCETLHAILGVSCSWMATYFLSCKFHESDHSATQTKISQRPGQRKRASRTKVAMLTFGPDAHVHRVDFSDINNLSTALNEPRNSHDDVHARLFVVEDLSRDVIEALGARFDVDPLFFRGHISDYMVRIVPSPLYLCSSQLRVPKYCLGTPIVPLKGAS